MSAKRRNKRKTSAIFPMVLILCGVLLMSLWGIHRYYYNRSISLSDAILARFAREDAVHPFPVSISVNKLINLPVVEAGKVNGVWAISQSAANHVHGSAVPGEPGNIIIYGHNAGNIFGPLDKAKIGDQIVVRTGDAITHRYMVASVIWVTPGHTELLSPTTIETLTLYTCGGLLDSLRIVIRAVPTK
jgi:LPXTG-site transpeptidase (sortase) family protein